MTLIFWRLDAIAAHDILSVNAAVAEGELDAFKKSFEGDGVGVFAILSN